MRVLRESKMRVMRVLRESRMRVMRDRVMVMRESALLIEACVFGCAVNLHANFIDA